MVVVGRHSYREIPDTGPYVLVGSTVGPIQLVVLLVVGTGSRQL